MTPIVFAGPSLREADLAQYPDIEFRAPVRQGELYAAARSGPKVIGIIDGYFDGVPAVWHKEVLWAMSQGIAVFGAASMGALRAAELHSFGMIGIGRIFQDFRDNRLTDDDEVALQHGPAEAGYVALSEPIVNIRATVECAVAENVLDPETAQRLLDVAKNQFYQRRSWETVLDVFASELLLDFRAWLPANKVDLKRQDALALLDAVRAHLADGHAAPIPAFAFEWTEAWANAPWLTGAGNLPREALQVLDELRLDGPAYRQTREAALLHMLAGRVQARSHAVGGNASTHMTEFRMARGLMRQKDVDHWAKQNDVDQQGVERLVAGRGALEQLAAAQDSELQGAMLDQLRLQGRYVALRTRAKARTEVWSSRRSAPPLPVLVAWYFGTRLGKPVPEDLSAHARDLGLSGIDRLHELLASEYALCAQEN
ncbi:TfuA-like protein [Paracoccus aestuariivivens]|uniref:TfuA-like core domain-containing protein n=1 Tax=Paracoccus aestuariivivens TaxID=1820333 RepID=A0A6L6J812_9RHOB|nr:TfuA-like protein [Paracoccus aestuariivivens]MTH76859.1 hypothetical protein [Paracoccus aestuariivivens]